MSGNERIFMERCRFLEPTPFYCFDTPYNIAKMFVTVLFIMLKIFWDFYFLLTFDSFCGMIRETK